MTTRVVIPSLPTHITMRILAYTLKYTTAAMLMAIMTAIAQLPSAYLPPAFGLPAQIMVTAAAAYLWRKKLILRSTHTVFSRSSAVKLAVSAALLANAFDATQHYWVPRSVPGLMADESSTLNGISLMIGGLCTAPLLEEAVFRVYLLSRLRLILSDNIAIFVSAATFALAHFDGARITVTLSSGICLATIVVATGQPLLAVLAHSMTNAFGLLEGAAVMSELPSRMGCYYPLACVSIAVVAAVNFRRTLINGGRETNRQSNIHVATHAA